MLKRSDEHPSNKVTELLALAPSLIALILAAAGVPSRNHQAADEKISRIVSLLSLRSRSFAFQNACAAGPWQLLRPAPSLPAGSPLSSDLYVNGLLSSDLYVNGLSSISTST